MNRLWLVTLHSIRFRLKMFWIWYKIWIRLCHHRALSVGWVGCGGHRWLAVIIGDNDLCRILLLFSLYYRQMISVIDVNRYEHMTLNSLTHKKRGVLRIYTSIHHVYMLARVCIWVRVPAQQIELQKATTHAAPWPLNDDRSDGELEGNETKASGHKLLGGALLGDRLRRRKSLH